MLLNLRTAGCVPYPIEGNIFRSTKRMAFSDRTQLVVNSSIRMGTKLSTFATHIELREKRYRGPGYFPSNPYDRSEDYEPTPHLMVAIAVLHWRLREFAVRIPAEPFMIATSGTPVQ